MTVRVALDTPTRGHRVDDPHPPTGVFPPDPADCGRVVGVVDHAEPDPTGVALQAQRDVARVGLDRRGDQFADAEDDVVEQVLEPPAPGKHPPEVLRHAPPARGVRGRWATGRVERRGGHTPVEAGPAAGRPTRLEAPSWTLAPNADHPRRP